MHQCIYICTMYIHSKIHKISLSYSRNNSVVGEDDGGIEKSGGHETDGLCLATESVETNELE